MTAGPFAAGAYNGVEAMTAGLSDTAQLSATPIQSAPEPAITFGAFNDLAFASDGFISLGQLRDVGIAIPSRDPLRVESNGHPGLPVDREVAAATPPGAYAEVSRWHDVRGSDIMLRQGYYDPNTGNALGLAKAALKHNLARSVHLAVGIERCVSLPPPCPGRRRAVRDINVTIRPPG